MYASMEGHTEIVRQLLAAGANPHLRNNSGQTALDLAREGWRTEIVRLLEAATQATPAP